MESGECYGNNNNNNDNPQCLFNLRHSMEHAHNCVHRIIYSVCAYRHRRNPNIVACDVVILEALFVIAVDVG